ncbi:MAG: hypothetical protein H6936_16360 [Burkholderiales bacterium]|nr:hypothetical protein [Nitrosomonas sp.]MCP5276386.1 hypothetical protein [Burkholderiales bacterium]
MTTYKVKPDATGKCHIFMLENNGNLRKISNTSGEVHAHGSIFKAQKRSDGKCCVFRTADGPGGQGDRELVLVQD